MLHMQALINAMPPVCRAQPGHDDPHDLTYEGLRALADARVRHELAETSLVPPRPGRRPKRLPIVETWLTALTSTNGHVEAKSSELDTLKEALRPWSVFESENIGPARGTFRLTETESTAPLEDGTHDAQWRLEFHLQSTADPSLMVPAAQVWSDDGALKRWLDTPQELLLEELGRASRIYPDIAEGLRQAQPAYVDLDTEAAFQFLERGAPALDQAGLGVLLPSWWEHRRALALKLSASTPADPKATDSAAFGRDQLCDFQWSLAVGDEDLTEAEITALAEAKAPLIRLRGQWVSVNAERLRRGLEFLRTEASGQMSVSGILSMAAAHPEDLDVPLEVNGVTADGWLGAFLEGRASQSLVPVEPPEGLQAELRPYQQRGLSWLAFLSSLGLGACLADDMGLGKTIQLLSLEARERAAETAHGPTLLLCPMSLVGNWQREAARFTPDLRVYAHHGVDRLRGEALAKGLDDVDLVVTTYGTALRDIEELTDIQWSRLVLDEAQAIKNSVSRTSKAVRRLRASQRIALTGTPMENRLSEMWSIMDFLNPGILGPQELFRTRYAIPVERYGDDEVASRLRTLTRPYVLRRLRTDPTIIDDLPEKIETTQYCRLTTEQASLYQSVVGEMMSKIEDSDGIQRRGNVLAAMAKLKQVCNHPAQLLHDESAIGSRSGKILRLEEVLEEMVARFQSEKGPQQARSDR